MITNNRPYGLLILSMRNNHVKKDNNEHLTLDQCRRTCIIRSLICTSIEKRRKSKSISKNLEKKKNEKKSNNSNCLVNEIA